MTEIVNAEYSSSQRDPALVTVSAYGRSAGSARVRIFDWLNHLDLSARSETYLDGSRSSHTQLLSHPAATWAAERRIRKLAKDPGDGPLVLSRRASPLSRGGLEESLLANSSRGVYDYDDALMIPAGGLRGVLSPRELIWRRAIESADVVIAGNEGLAEQARVLGAHVSVIPSCIEPKQYTRRKRSTQRDTPLAVWIGTPSTEGYLGTIAQPLLRAHKETGLRLKVISAGDAPLGEIDVLVDRVKWTWDGFATELADADFGIMPLSNTEWARGKCAYKLLQYAATGLHLVGDPVGTNERVLHLTAGMSPHGVEEWADALIQSSRMSETELQDRGDYSRTAVEKEYSFQRWEEAWCNAVFGTRG